MTTHHLKTVNPFFEQVLAGDKTFEFRIDDRGYSVGDTLRLAEYIPEEDTFTGREHSVIVTHIMRNTDFASVPRGWVILSTKPVQEVAT